MELIFEILNLGNDENPCLVKIGSTLNEKERKDLKDLLTEFQEVFAWSYEDMSSIDPEIAQHRVDTYSHIVLVTKKLRCIRTEWLLQRGGHQALESRVHQTRAPSLVDSNCCAST